jgi:hypothetical protein
MYQYWIVVWVAVPPAWVYAGWKAGGHAQGLRSFKLNAIYLLVTNFFVVYSVWVGLETETYLLSYFPEILWVSPILGLISYLAARIRRSIKSKQDGEKAA